MKAPNPNEIIERALAGEKAGKIMEFSQMAPPNRTMARIDQHRRTAAGGGGPTDRPPIRDGGDNMDAFTRAYIRAALWSSTDHRDESGGDPLDSNYGPEDISQQTLAQMKADCAKFQEDNRELLDQSGMDDSRAGHNFWLNRNGHGSGFWDEHSQTTCDAYEREQATAVQTRDFSKREGLNKTCSCPYHVCQRLSAASKAWGEFDLYVGDDEQIHGS